MEKFDSGAARSSDAADTDYWLITPIGLSRLATYYSEIGPQTPVTKPQHINIFYNVINQYLHGYRDELQLEVAAYTICELINRDHKYTNIIEPGLGYYNISPIVLKELAATYAEGKLKYCAYNCELGFPVHDLLNHALRHITEYRLGQIDDRHLPHALWNVLMAMHSEEKWPHLNDPYLRGENCELTEAIRKRIDEEMRAKNAAKAGAVGDEKSPGRSTRTRAKHARRSSG